MKKILAATLGKLSWEKPVWLSLSFAKCRQNPKKTKKIFASFVLLIAACLMGYIIYQNLPKPEQIAAQLRIPAIMINTKHEITPQPLHIVFDHSDQNNILQSSDNEMGDNNYTSVAPLSQIGKIVTQGIEVTPAIPGRWQWKSDKALEFMPNTAWPAGTEYTVHFSKSLFEKKYSMPAWKTTFTTIPLSISIQAIKFFQDILHPENYKTSMTVDFNYPVDSRSFSQNIKLFFPETQQQLPYTISYNPGNFQAYIQADIKPLPDHAQYLKLEINKNIKPLNPGNPTLSPLQAQLIIPDKSSVLKIHKISAIIVHNDQGQPEQILTVETTTGVTTDALVKSLHAYLLPRDYPAVGNMPIQKNYSWHNPGEVNINMLTQKIDVTAIPTEKDYETLHSFKYHIEPNRYVYISIDKGLPSYQDYTLALPYAAIVETPEYPKEINFLHPGSLLALTGEKKVSVIIRGLPAVKFTIARVLPDEINHLITQTSGDFQNPRFINDSFNATDISTLNSEINIFDNSDKSKAQYIALDLSKYLNKQSFKLGLFLLKAEGWNPNTKTTTDTANNRLILITDIDMLAKTTLEGSHDIFVQSITQGTPIASAKVEVLGRNGLPIITQTTDVQGHAYLPSLKDFTDDKAPAVYVISKDNDIAFMPYSRNNRMLNYSRFDTGGDTNTHKYGLNAFLFSDRGIYRPGETLHLGLIIKGNYAAPTIPGLPLELLITDPRGMTVYDQKFTSNITGLITKEYSLDATALTGDYRASLYVTKDNSPDDLLGSASIQVQEFEPDQLKISTNFLPAALTTEGWVSPQNLNANVQLWNLFGTPAADRRITGKLYFLPKPLKFSLYPDYIFSDPYRDPNKPLKVFTENLSDIKTDNTGKAVFNLDLSRYAQSTYQLTLLTQGFAAEGGRGVSQTSSILVSPLSYLIGFKADGDLNYIRQNTQRNINFISINSALKQIAAPNLQLQLIKLNSITTLAKQPDGSYQYQTVIQEHQINQKDFFIIRSGNNYALPTDQIGDYKLKIIDQNNLLLSQIGFSVIGQGEKALAKNSTLTLKLNKKDYLPGENIQMNITAPYNGWGLITLERDKVYAYKWFKLDGASTVESITVPNDFEGTGYINVALVRDWNSDEIFMNPLSYNVQSFSVIPDARRMHITLNAPDHVYPGKPLSIEYSSDKPGNIIIYAIDEGILQVANYQTPDPLGYYFKKQALTVDTEQIADQILPKYIANRELSAIGGGGEQKSIASNLNPFARKVAPVVYWSGILSTDNQTHQVTYNIPDYFNGTLRIMAIGVSTNAVGAAAKKIISKDDIVLTPNAPIFVAPRDQFEVSVSIANTSKINMPIKISLKTDAKLTMTDNTEQTLVIAKSTEKTAIFKLKANDLLGDTDIIFIANANNKSFQRKINLSVRPVTPYQTNITSGYSTSNKSLDITSQLYPELRTLKAISSTNPFILITGLKDYLENYPYSCTEQLVSRAYIQLALKDQPGYTDTEKFNTAYSKVIQILRQRQTSDGSFSYWPSGDSRPFATIYAASFLTDAKLRGNEVPADMLNQVLANLKDYAGSTINNISDARLHAYAIYILTRNEVITTDYIANLQAYFQQAQDKTWQKDITGVYLAAAYQMLQNNKTAEKLIAGYDLFDSNHPTDEFYNALVMNGQYVSIVANYFPQRLKKLNTDQLIPLVNNLTNDQISSLSAAISALALSDYAKAVAVNNHEDKLSIIAISKNNRNLLNSPEFGPDVVKLQFKTQDQTGYFYQIIQAGFDKNLPNQAIKSGLEVFREFQNDQGEPVTATNLGNTLEVHLRIRTSNNQTINNIAVVDLFPGGFELVPKSITPKNPNNTYLNYYAAREDRIIFYLSASNDVQEYTYKIRAINKGSYAIPPIFAASMYNPKIMGENIGGTMVVQ